MSEPTLFEQTMELGKLLETISDADPTGHPMEKVSAVFREWIRVALPHSTEQRYLADVLENYDVSGNSNKDLSLLFSMLHPYVDMEPPEETPVRRLIKLPMA